MIDSSRQVVQRMLAESRTDFEGFWSRAAEQLPWFRKWDKVFESDYPSFRWFVGAQTNISYNAVDRHVKEGRGSLSALIYENEAGDRRVLTYDQLLDDVKLVAAGLRALGINRGDRVAIYMPTIPEAIIAMLATTRIGAIHLVVFAGFGSTALADRVRAAGARVLITTDFTLRKGKKIDLKEIVDRALETLEEQIRHVVVLQRGSAPIKMQPERDLNWETFLARGAKQAGDFEIMEANEPSYILATSGTTAKPKLAVHTQGGYQVGVYSMGRWVFGLKPNDIWWSTSDIGWVVGHSYIVYAPLITGCTTIAYEGALDHPKSDVFWRTITDNHVTGVFTSPTAIRMLMRHGSKPTKSHDISSLERVFGAGEVLNPPVLHWFEKEALGDRVPVIDHMWQTETGGPVFGNPFGISKLQTKPGSAGIALPGIDAGVMSYDGQPCSPCEKGIVVLKKPFPSLTPTLWGESERYARDYWEKIPACYYTGDAGYVDEDGYYWFLGRADEVINIAAHRIGTIEVETAFLQHPAVAEAGVTGRPDPIRGEVICAFVVLGQGFVPSDHLQRELIKTVRNELGPIAVIGETYFVNTLPKTRSGKIMRRVLKAVLLDVVPGDITAIEDEGSVKEARAAWENLKSMMQKVD